MTPNDVKIVAENIYDFVEVPNGIERLRKAVLTLAVAGKLVDQDENEGTAEDLYTEIQTERSNSKKSTKEFPQVVSEDMLFNIPKSWKWVPFGSMFLDYGSGSTPSRSNDKYYSASGVNWYKSGELNDAVLPVEAKEKVSELALKECRLRIFKPMDFLIAMYGATAGRIAVSNSTGTTNQAVWSGTPATSLDDRYLYYYILQSRQILIDKSSGAAQPNISGEKIIAHPFALPPLEEQKRIVKKVEEVMNQLDQLEIKKRESEETRTRLACSAMQSLGKGDSKIAFEQLIELIKNPNDIKELENALLTLAVSGKLVPQDKSEGTAEELFNQIQLDRSKNAEGKKKKAKELTEITEKEIPFEIPKSWKWVRLGSCVSISSGDLLKVSEATEGEYLVYGGNGIAGRHSKYNAVKGTIVIGRVGALCGIAHITETNAWVTDNAFIVTYPEELLDKNFFAVLLNNLNLRKSHRGSAQPVISGLSVYPTPMPLPPLAEQKRIIKKVEVVMILINHLKQVLKN